jgi:hypothetical protein
MDLRGKILFMLLSYDRYIILEPNVTGNSDS